MENLKVRDLRLITLLGRFDSLRALARHLDLEPQNVSKKFESIESALGKKLFTRSPRGISLTHDGQRAVRDLEDVLSKIGKIETGHRDQPVFDKTLKISSRGFIMSFMAPALVRGFLSSSVELSLVDQSPEAMEQSARRNLLDLVYHFGDVDLGRSWQKTKVGQIPYVTVVKDSHPLGSSCQLKDLKNYQIVGGCYIENGKFITPQLPEFFRGNFSRGYNSENSNYTKTILQQSSQFAILPLVSVIEELKQGRLRTLQVKGVPSLVKTVFAEVQVDQVTRSTKEKVIAISKKRLQELKNF